ncbi:hypothetical protein [Protaetiibacter larvae]|uniref:Uncharacterized protein n=1 Tax=Protaetiibacter larvae TaxID=2592654 RepID=A0A5C1Y7L8_9MICO|nr:hypothetical protein [Protaetiibacter larvae]QEO08897.1 hypothetical protein FLP23_01980 [Protaetiibacter larvae]
MTRTTSKNPTLREHFALARDKVVTAVHDKAQEAHPKQSSTVCGATRNASGELLVCGLAVHHPGDHEAGARSWRRSSSDEETAA